MFFTFKFDKTLIHSINSLNITNIVISNQSLLSPNLARFKTVCDNTILIWTLL